MRGLTPVHATEPEGIGNLKTLAMDSILGNKHDWQVTDIFVVHSHQIKRAGYVPYTSYGDIYIHRYMYRGI